MSQLPHFSCLQWYLKGLEISPAQGERKSRGGVIINDLLRRWTPHLDPAWLAPERSFSVGSSFLKIFPGLTPKASLGRGSRQEGEGEATLLCSSVRRATDTHGHPEEVLPHSGNRCLGGDGRRDKWVRQKSSPGRLARLQKHLWGL